MRTAFFRCGAQKYAGTVASIPGFSDGGGLYESAPFAHLDESDAVRIARDTFGITATRADRLDTERDDSFRLVTATADFVLKVAHPDDPAAAINLQTAALQHAAGSDAELPLQRVHPSADGRVEPVVDGRIARLLDWIPGTPLYQLRPDDTQLAQLGGSLARLSRALRGFSHPAASRPFAWDVLRAADLRPLLDDLPNAPAAEALRRLERDVLPHAGQLPMQVIHNDFHPGNVLVDAASENFVVGILDFGDTVHTARVADVAVAASYLLFPGGHTWRELETFIDGYGRVAGLSALERSVILPLAGARFAQRILVNWWLGRGNPDDRAATTLARDGNTAALAALLDTEN
jgi:hydroxylysine kinase